MAYALTEIPRLAEHRVYAVVLKVAAPCNLDCSYCYVYHGRDQTFTSRPALLSEAIARAALSRLRNYCARRGTHQIAICLHGGEPLLAGKERFRQLVRLIRGELRPYVT